MSDVLGRVGLDRQEYAGMYVVVEEDASGTGYHVWLSERHPASGPGPGWDIWADDERQLERWLEALDVRWLGNGDANLPS